MANDLVNLVVIYDSELRLLKARLGSEGDRKLAVGEAGVGAEVHAEL